MDIPKEASGAFNGYGGGKVQIYILWILLSGNAVASQQALPINDATVIEIRDARCVVIPPNSTYTQWGCRRIAFPEPASVNESVEGGSLCVGACFMGEYITSAVDCKYQLGSTCKLRLGKIKVRITHVGYCKEPSCICVFERLRYPVEMEEVGGVQCL